MYKFYRFYVNCKGVVRRLRRKHILDHLTPKHYMVINDAAYFDGTLPYIKRQNNSLIHHKKN
jgi:hypothetical protein